MAMLGLGFEIAVPVLVLLFVGMKVDTWLGSQPWLMVAGMFLGMIVGSYNLYKRVVPVSRDRNGGGK